MLHEMVNSCDGMAPAVLQPRTRPGRYAHASAWRHLLAWHGSCCASRRERLAGWRSTHRQSGAQWRHRHSYRPKHKQRRWSMFDSGDFAIGNVWIPRDLRRWRNGNRNHDARHHGNVGHRGELWNINAVRHINFVGHLGDLGTVDVLRDDGNVGIVWNVRRRLQQPRWLVVSNVAHLNVLLAEWQRSSRNSAGFFRDWQSWGQPH